MSRSRRTSPVRTSFLCFCYYYFCFVGFCARSRGFRSQIRVRARTTTRPARSTTRCADAQTTLGCVSCVFCTLCVLCVCSAHSLLLSGKPGVGCVHCAMSFVCSCCARLLRAGYSTEVTAVDGAIALRLYVDFWSHTFRMGQRVDRLHVLQQLVLRNMWCVAAVALWPLIAHYTFCLIRSLHAGPQVFVCLQACIILRMHAGCVGGLHQSGLRDSYLFVPSVGLWCACALCVCMCVCVRGVSGFA